MRYIKFFEGDSRNSEMKKRIIESDFKKRLRLMKSLSDFKNFGKSYWDAKKMNIGYGGYIYDGRYKKVAKKND